MKRDYLMVPEWRQESYSGMRKDLHTKGYEEWHSQIPASHHLTERPLVTN